MVTYVEHEIENVAKDDEATLGVNENDTE